MNLLVNMGVKSTTYFGNPSIFLRVNPAARVEVKAGVNLYV